MNDREQLDFMFELQKEANLDTHKAFLHTLDKIEELHEKLVDMRLQIGYLKALNYLLIAGTIFSISLH